MSPAAATLAWARSTFVDNVRFWSMLAVVTLHSIGAVHMELGDSVRPECPRWLEVFAKFGTIDFFLVSGFLLGERFETDRRSVVLGRRLQKIFLPWMFWFLSMTAMFLAVRLVRHSFPAAVSLLGSGWIHVTRMAFHLIFMALSDCLTSTAFWFVPNLFLSICVLLLLRKYLRSLRLGVVLFSATLFYAINIYTLWIPSSHLTALGGFIFFLWLGSFASRRYEQLVEGVRRIPLYVSFLLVLATGVLSFGETNLLLRLGHSDALNTLRITNQMYSLAVALFILKVQRATWPSFIDVRKQMFGVYLIHALVLNSERRILEGVCSFYGLSLPRVGAFVFLLLTAAVTTSVFAISLSITRALAGHASLAWLIGDQSIPKPSKGDKSGYFFLLTHRTARAIKGV